MKCECYLILCLACFCVASCNSGKSDQNDGGDGDAMYDIDRPPGINLALPIEGVTYRESVINIIGSVWDDVEVRSAYVHLQGDVSTFFEPLELFSENPDSSHYLIDYSKVLPENCHLIGEEFQVIITVTDTSEQTSSKSVKAYYSHHCIPCEVVVTFNEGVTVGEIEAACGEIGASIYQEAENAYPPNSYLIDFPIEMNRDDVVSHFESKDIVYVVDPRCFIDI